MPRQFRKVHTKRDVGVFQGSFQRMEMTLSSSNPMEKANQLMQNRIFTEEGDLFDCVEDDRSFEDGGVKRVNAM